jgi:phenylalanyl-tRNA synthetase beta chain
MPTIDVESRELERLLGLTVHGNLEKLDDILALVKGEVKLYDEKEGIVSIEMKDTNRPDLWSVEGLTRGLQGFLGKKTGLQEYAVGKPIVDIAVDSRLKNIRPFIGCCIIRNVKLTDAIIRGFMHLQDKLDQTNGRNRQKTSIGLYDFNLIKPPLTYGVAKPDEISFVPLGFTEKLTLAEILERHPKGIEYGHIVKKHKVFPILLDAKRKVLSFPPIINSNDLGRVTEETHDLLIEVTGTANETVLNTVKFVSLALIDRGGKAYAANVHYEHDNSTVVTPSFASTQMRLDVGYANKILGLKLNSKQISELLGIAGFDIIKADESALEVAVPCYRTDVMHQVDLIEDVAIAYGYNNIEPVWRDLPTTGCVQPQQRLLDKARELMVGSGFQEILTYTLTNIDNLIEKMSFGDWNQDTIIRYGQIVEVANPKVVTMTCLRNWLLPSLMELLGNNKSVEFPQRIFELGKITVIDETRETRTRDEDWLSAVVSHPTASFSEIKSVLDAFLMNLGVEWKIKPTNHPSFVNGRVGAVLIDNDSVGFVGEINPQVIVAWGLENPSAAFELNLTSVFARKLL